MCMVSGGVRRCPVSPLSGMACFICKIQRDRGLGSPNLQRGEEPHQKPNSFWYEICHFLNTSHRFGMLDFETDRFQYVFNRFRSKNQFIWSPVQDLPSIWHTFSNIFNTSHRFGILLLPPPPSLVPATLALLPPSSCVLLLPPNRIQS